MDKILVTGGAGFIGSHLVERLSRDNEVTVLDDLSTGENVMCSGVKYVRGDILDLVSGAYMCKDADYIFHLAANSDVLKSINSPEKDMQINIQGTLNMLKSANNVKCFVYFSSAAIYGSNGTNPLSFYGISKLAAEQYCLACQEIYGIPVVILRCFNVYGERSRNGVIPVLLDCIKSDRPFTIYGDGEQSRDFVYVDDVVEMAAKSVEYPGEIINVGTGRSVSINLLVDRTAGVIGQPIEVVYEDARKGDILHSRATVKNLNEFGIKPTKLEDGLKLMIERERICQRF